MKKIYFLALCIFLIGCSNDISKKQKTDYQDTLKNEYQDYSYSYMKKENQYEIEFTKNIEEVLLKKNVGKEDIEIYEELLANNFSTISEDIIATPLAEVFEDNGVYKEQILEKITQKDIDSELSISLFSVISGDIFSILNENNFDDLYIFKSVTGFLTTPDYHKIIKVLTDEPYIFVIDNMVYLAQNTSEGAYAVNIVDEKTFNFLKGIYFTENKKEEQNKNFSHLLAANEDILISLRPYETLYEASHEEVDAQFTILNSFLVEKNLNNGSHNILQGLLDDYYTTNNGEFAFFALKLASDNRTNFINDLQNQRDTVSLEEKKNTKLSKPDYSDKNEEDVYRIDGIESKYTYTSSLLKNAVKEVTKLSETPIDSNYIVLENEMGELYITIYSLEVQDEIIEKYIFDPYTKIITSEKDYGSSSDNTESVSKVINEAIIEVENQTSYSNQFPYTLSGFVTDDGLIEIDIGISDENNSGGVIIQDQAIYDPDIGSLKKFPKNAPAESNDSSTEDTLLQEAQKKVEQETGYIEGNPYVYDVHIIEEGVIQVEVRAAGAGNSGTMSLVDSFQYYYPTKELYIYDVLSNNYELY